MSPAQENSALVELIMWIDERIANIELPGDERSLLIVGCFDVAIEHQAAVALLFSAGLHGSMFSLLRVLTESLVRGLWLQYSATEDEILAFKRGRIDKAFRVLVSEVEAEIQVKTPILSDFIAKAWQSMNDFTHTGYKQISRRHGSGVVGPNYPETELCQSQSLAGALGLIAACQLASLSGQPEWGKEIIQRMSEYAKRAV